MIPLLSQYLLKRAGEFNLLERVISRLNHLFLNPLQDFFVGLFHTASRTPRVLWIPPAIILLLISVRVVMPLAGRDLMPPMDTGIIKISFETEPNLSLEQVEAIVSRMEGIIRKTPGYIRMATMVGSEPGVISFGAERTPQQGLMTVHFVDRFHRRETIWEIEEHLRREFSRIPGLKYVHVYDFGATPFSSIAAPVDVMISGPDARVLDRLAEEVKAWLLKVRGLTTVSRSWDLEKREVWVILDLERLKHYGLTPLAVSEALRAAFSGAVAGILRVPGEDGYTLRVRSSSHLPVLPHPGDHHGGHSPFAHRGHLGAPHHGQALLHAGHDGDDFSGGDRGQQLHHSY